MNQFKLKIVAFATFCAFSGLTAAQVANFCMADLDKLDAVSIVRITGSPSSEVRYLVDDRGLVADVVCQVGLVVSNLKGTTGERVNLVMPSLPGGGLPLRLVEGRNYLILATKLIDGLLMAPTGSWLRTKGWKKYISASANEIWVVQALPTGQSTLALKGETNDIVFQSIVDCLVEATLADAAEIISFLNISKYPGATSDEVALPKTPSKYAQALIDMAEHASLSTKAGVWGLLNKWTIVGSADMYLATLVRCGLDEASSSEVEFALEPISFWEDPMNRFSPMDYLHKLPSPGDWANSVLASRSDKLRTYLLDKLGGLKPDRAQEVALARFLDSENVEVRCFLCRHFAVVQGNMEKWPQRIEETTEQGTRYSYPDLAEFVEFWRVFWSKG